MAVQNQVKLPISVALEVVLQGIRIRIGRSLVTITGVICGIAFLMSILTGQLIKKGVQGETDIQNEVKRMKSFIATDLPGLNNKSIALSLTGPLSEAEKRLIIQIGELGLAQLYLNNSNHNLPKEITIPSKSNDAQLSQGDFIFIMGQGEAPKHDWSSVYNKRTIVSTLENFKVASIDESFQVPLARKLSDEEKAKIESDKRKDKFRSIWIGIVSLLVTIIGITNAMLMSVTERFREIGTMKCLGALSGFIRNIFLLESSIMGIAGGVVGVIIGIVFSYLSYSFTFGFDLVFSSLAFGELSLYGVISLITGIILSVVAALYPARVASNMVPANALRSNV